MPHHAHVVGLLERVHPSAKFINIFVNTPTSVGAHLFNDLGLTWQDAYLDPDKRQSTIRTFSALQVRNKVTKAYFGRGQNYIEFMGEAAEALQNLIE